MTQNLDTEIDMIVYCIQEQQKLDEMSEKLSALNGRKLGVSS